MKTIYGADISTDPDSPDGQMIGLWSQALADLEELAGEMWRQMDPDYATGPNLDRVVNFAGIRRTVDSPSYLRSVILSGTPLIYVPADSLARDQSGIQWRSMQRVRLDANGSARVDFQSVDAGAFNVGANTVLDILAGVTGWVSAITSRAATTGTDQETDPPLRARFYLSRERTAQDDASSMLGNLLALNGVDDAQVYENYKKYVDHNGTEPNSINAVVNGGDESSIGQVILQRKPAGTGMQGESTVYVVDQFSRVREIVFDRPTKVAVHVEAQVTRRANFTDIDDEAIAEALARLNFKIGIPVIRTELYAPMYSIPGFIVTRLWIGTDTLAPAEQDIAIGPREKAVIDADNVSIVVV
ncbi:baseplate J/gp47 family protein [Paraburkholderia sp. BR10936]|uniref:baseplate J/gp47 family protein n=1 Tax=Paraburkholderia sp. BR10936 TaxID=3236993 RepID=UPI0034D1BDCC